MGMLSCQLGAALDIERASHSPGSSAMFTESMKWIRFSREVINTELVRLPLLKKHVLLSMVCRAGGSPEKGAFAIAPMRAMTSAAGSPLALSVMVPERKYGMLSTTTRKPVSCETAPAIRFSSWNAYVDPSSCFSAVVFNSASFSNGASSYVGGSRILGCQHSTTPTANPPSDVSLYLDCMSSPVRYITSMT